MRNLEGLIPRSLLRAGSFLVDIKGFDSAFYSHKTMALNHTSNRRSRMKRLNLFLRITVPVFILLMTMPVLADQPILTIDTGGHKSTITETIFTSDGRYLVSASNDKTIRVWDVATGEVVRVLRGQVGGGAEGRIYAAALSPDDGLLAVAGYLGQYRGIGPREDEGAHKIRLINFQTGEVTSLLKGHSNVINGLAFSSDGTRLISGSSDKTARIWDVRTQETIHVFQGHTERIYAVAFSPDGDLAVTGSNDDTMKLWNTGTGSLVKTLKGHEDKVRSAAFTPDGRYLLSGSDDKTIRLWDGKTGRFIKVFAKQNRGVLSISISPDSKYVVSGIGGAGSGGNECRIFSIPSGNQITSFTKHRNIVLATTISPDGKTAATGGGDDQEIYLWNLTTGQVKQKMGGKGKRIWSVGFAKDGRSIAWGKTFKQSGYSMYQIRGPLEQAFQIKEDGRKYDLAMGGELHADTGYLRALESVGPWSIRTKNGKIHPTLQILKNGSVEHEITRGPTDGNYHRSLTLTPDGQTVISGGSWGVITSYNPQTRKKIHGFTGHTGDVWGVASSPDSQLLVSGADDQTVRLWEIGTGKLLLTIFQGTDNEWVAWTPEGYYTASLNGDKYVGWHVNRGEDKAALYYPASRFAKQFYSPEIVARYIETGGDIDEAIRLVNAERPRQKQIIETRVADLQSILPPAVFFREPSQRDVTVNENRIRIRAGAKAVNQEKITDIWLLINGRRVDKSRGIAVTGKESKRIDGLRAEIDLVIPLTQERNRISVLASNRHTQSEPDIINVQMIRKAKASPDRIEDIYKPDLYVLAIGVSKYENPDYNLDYAHKDAIGLASVLEKQSGKLYNNVFKRVLIDQEATQDDVLDGLDWILKEATQKDVSIIFVAGHGLKDERGNYYFLPYDGQPDKLRRTSVRWVEFQDVLTSLPSKVILLADTCHSGSITGKRRGLGDMTDALRELITTESGVVVMAASTGKEESQEKPEWGHGAFTKALIEGLEGAANYNKDKTIDIKELDLFVTYRVKELTRGSQHPTTEIPKTMPNFPIVFK